MNLEERNEENRVFFDERVDGYDENHAPFMNTKKQITDNLEGNINKVVDLGAGTGLELTFLYEKYPDAHTRAIDITQSMLDKIKERPFGDKVETVCSDLFKADLGTDVDAAISTSALHHFLYEEKEILYKKVFDSLRDGGVFINCDKIAFSDEEELKCIEDNKNHTYKHNDMPLTIDHEVEILKTSGFKNIEVMDTDKDNYRLFKATK